MRGAGLAGVALVALGALTAQAGLVLMGVLLLLVEGLATLWSRRGLRNVVYERRFEPDRAVVGDQIALETTVTNRKLLPLAWLRIEDHSNADLAVHELPLERDAATGGGISDSHSLLPDTLYHAFATYGTLLSPDLPLTRRQHEMIATVVSVINDCFY